MIYVDELFTVSKACYHGSAANQAQRVGAKHGHTWCHLWCDDGEVEDLHAMAARIGLRRSWFQNKAGFPHYDLVANRRDAAIRAGATPRRLIDWLREHRRATGGMTFDFA